MKTLLSIFLFGGILSATPVNVSYVGPNNWGQTVIDAHGEDVYVGPYTLNLNGKTVEALCIDDLDVTRGSWTANITQMNSSNLSNTYFGNQTLMLDSYHFTSQQAYDAEAYLFSQIIKPANYSERPQIQLAAWAVGELWLTDSSWALSTLNSTEQTYVEDAALAVYDNTFNASGYEILSDTNKSSCDREQEFILANPTPEPATCAMLGGGLLLVGLSRFLKRRKKDGGVA